VTAIVCLFSFLLGCNLRVDPIFGDTLPEKTVSLTYDDDPDLIMAMGRQTSAGETRRASSVRSRMGRVNSIVVTTCETTISEMTSIGTVFNTEAR